MGKIKHGASFKGRMTPTYRIWVGMRQRCNNPSNCEYASYGKRGISVCARWNDFSAFLSDMGERPRGRSIDRINNDGDYELSNCRWVTPSEQARNTRRTKMLSFNGETMCMKDWARKIGLRPDTLWRRLAGGWPVEEALTRPRMAVTHSRRERG